MSEELSFPPGFTWGAATSAYQIEGACSEDGRGPSIWDTFSHRRGRVRGGANGDVSADHYHRWEGDLDLLQSMGLKAYRFSLAWTRVVPEGSGPVNSRGLDFYSRLVDGLLERGITPYPTLFHYDLPQPLQDAGGWPRRETALRFADYAAAVADCLGDRVEHWITHNEPWVAAVLGHLLGQHAPGHHSLKDTFWSLHHMLLSHGLAVQALRSRAGRPIKVSMAVNLSPVYPLDPANPRHVRAAAAVDTLANRLVLDPLWKGTYPAPSASFWWARPGRRLLDCIQPGDMQVISTPLDFLGVNYYTRMVVRSFPGAGFLPVKMRNRPHTSMWEIYPEGLYDLLLRLERDYSHPELLVLENGAPMPDVVSPDGKVHDTGRIAYLEAHLEQVCRAMQAGVPVTGYFVWSLLDNFEWALGYAERFGLVYVDYATQQRIPKDSAAWLEKVISSSTRQS